MSENNYGVGLLSEDKYGYGAEESVLTLTLLKSGSFPYVEAAESIPEFTYSLYPHSGDFRKGGVIEAAYLLNRPLKAITLEKQNGRLPEEYSLITCETGGVYIETVKMAEDGDGMIVRMYEAFKETKTAVLRFGTAVKSVYLCNLLEKEERELSVQDGVLYVQMKPFEIITLKVR